MRPLILSLLAFAVSAASAAEEARLLRFADIHGDKIAFVYAGDLWTVSAAGGAAQRLTTHEGLELFPKFSPDGRWLAFSAEYGGNRQVYVMPVDGGTPRQLTWYNDVGELPPRGGFDYQVLDWTPDGKNVLVRANRVPWSERMGRPYLVPVAGGMERPLAVPEGGGGMLSPDGTKLVYTPIDREWRTWKRYKGGRAQDVWIYDLKRDAAEQLTDYPGTDNQPLWVGDTVYFTSDREKGRLNLFAYDLKTKQTKQVTFHQDFDVLWPSAGAEAIVYECGGYLYRFDPRAGKSQQVHVELAGDFAQTVPYFKAVASQINDAGLSPSGKRALFEARGDLFTVPAEHGEVRNVTLTPGIREIEPSWSPDGRWVAYLSDRSGEYEIYVRAPDGIGAERRVTNDGDVWRYAPVWSPDSSKLAYADTRQRLHYVAVDGGKSTDVDHAEFADITQYGWSPDSRWLVYTKTEETQFSSIYVYGIETRKSERLSTGLTNDQTPVFDPGGRYLFFLSDRDYNLTFSGFEFNYLYTNPTRVYAATLKRDGPALRVPKSDEEEPKKEKTDEPPKAADQDKPKDERDAEKADRAAAKQKKDEAPARVEIDVENFPDRVIALPGAAGNYRRLAATRDGVLVLVGDGSDTELKLFSFESEKTETVLSGIADYRLSGDGKKVLFRQGEKWGIADVKAGQKPTEGLLKLEGIELKIDPRAEWKQIFTDGWRILRDWFYDSNMHGLDWKGMRELYAPLVDHVATRADLDYILGELGGELSAGHVYVNWGDMPRPKRADNGMLGAEIEADASGYFRITKIFPGENWQDATRSPLTEPGVNARVGDFILSVDGRSTREVKNFYELLEKKAGKVVRLQLNSKPDTAGARTAQVRPIAKETALRYLDWVRSRRELVERLSGGRIGYIHLPNTAAEGNRELQKYFYPQARKEALIFDARYNGGGFIPDRMIEMVGRTQLSFWARRGVQPARTPGYAHRGPKACLINGYSSSGGDAFPYYFRKMGLGKLIGTRTWGGLIGLSGNPGLIDGGSINVPTFRFMDTDGKWAVEGEGVAPDIPVVDRPDLVAQGHDPTLEKAVEVLLEELRRNPPAKLTWPEPPRIPR